MAALSANKLVCSAMPDMTLMTLPTSMLLSPSFAMVALVICASSTARVATVDAWIALADISRMLTVNSVTLAETVCILLLTCSAEDEAAVACVADASALLFIWVLTADSSSDEEASVAAFWLIAMNAFREVASSVLT